MSVVLDTHAWVWWVEGDNRLGRKTLRALDELPENERPILCDISIWEVATLLVVGRWNCQMPFETWLEKATHPRTVTVMPITTAVGLELTRLPPKPHKDPADRIIISTARALKLPLLTLDRRILASRLTKRWPQS
jgi:PIN domain nuclease of toxin-antitoxin system